MKDPCVPRDSELFAQPLNVSRMLELYDRNRDLIAHPCLTLTDAIAIYLSLRLDESRPQSSGDVPRTNPRAWSAACRPVAYRLLAKRGELGVTTVPSHGLRAVQWCLCCRAHCRSIIRNAHDGTFGTRAMHTRQAIDYRMAWDR